MMRRFTGRGGTYVVHDHVDREISADRDPTNRGAASELGEAEQGGGGVVEDVQELKTFLLGDEKAGVEEFPILEAM